MIELLVRLSETDPILLRWIFIAAYSVVISLVTGLTWAVLVQRRKMSFLKATLYEGKPRQAQKNSYPDSVSAPEPVSSLRHINRHFLQVLVPKFELYRKGQGAKLDISFDLNVQAIWSRQGKEWLNDHVLDGRTGEIQRLQNQLNGLLLEDGKKPVLFDDQSILFRYVSGGTLPIVSIGNQDYCCLFYREIFPIGWNIANGGSDSLLELIDPRETMKRELSEELIVIDPEQEVRYQFAETPELQEFVVAWKLLEDMGLGIVASFEPQELILDSANGPDLLEINISNSARKEIDDIFLNINAEDLGIEIDRVVRFEVDENARFVDGELCDGPDAGFRLVNAPVGLFKVESLESTFRNNGEEFVPDLLFWSGQLMTGRESNLSLDLDTVVKNKFIPSMELDLGEDGLEYWHSCDNKYDFCPVTRSIIRRCIDIGWENLFGGVTAS